MSSHIMPPKDQKTLEVIHMNNKKACKKLAGIYFETCWEKHKKSVLKAGITKREAKRSIMRNAKPEDWIPEDMEMNLND